MTTTKPEPSGIQTPMTTTAATSKKQNDPPSAIALIGAKGGTYKTSTVSSLAHLLAVDRRVLMVDLDPQGSLTRRSGMDRVANPLESPPVLVGAENGGMDDHLWLMPGGRALEGASFDELAAHLDGCLDAGFDIVVIDTPPALGPAVLAAAEASDLVVVPAVPGEESLIGYGDMLQVIGNVAPGTPVRALLVQAHMQSNILKWAMVAFAGRYPGALFGPVVPFEMAAAESGSLHVPVTASAPRSRSAEAYRQLASTIVRDLRLPTLTQQDSS